MDHYEKPKVKELIRFIGEFWLLCFVLYTPAFFLYRESTTPHSLILSVSLSIPQLVILVVVMTRQQGIDPKEFGLTRFTITDLFLSFLFWIILLSTIMILITLYSRWTGYTVRAKSLLESQTAFRSLGGIFLILLYSFAIGYKEEMFFRSYLLTRASNLGLHSLYTSIIGSILFGIGHLYQGGFISAIAFLQGLLFSLFFLKSRNLHALAIAHSLYNFSILVGIDLAKTLLLETGASPF